jgi:hypothetical protein
MRVPSHAVENAADLAERQPGGEVWSRAPEAFPPPDRILSTILTRPDRGSPREKARKQRPAARRAAPSHGRCSLHSGGSRRRRWGPRPADRTADQAVPGRSQEKPPPTNSLGGPEHAVCRRTKSIANKILYHIYNIYVSISWSDRRSRVAPSGSGYARGGWSMRRNSKGPIDRRIADHRSRGRAAVECTIDSQKSRTASARSGSNRCSVMPRHAGLRRPESQLVDGSAHPGGRVVPGTTIASRNVTCQLSSSDGARLPEP